MHRSFLVALLAVAFAMASMAIAAGRVAAGRVAADVARGDEVVRVRFRAPPSASDALRSFDGARSLFGDVDEVRAAAPALAAWFVVDTAAPGATLRALREAGALDVDVEPRFEPAAVELGARDDGPSCPIKTPSYDARQGYRAAVAIDAATDRGAGVSVADIEGEWNDAHEDLPGERMRHVAGTRFKDPGWRAHGTAVLGVVAAKDNAVGMLGLAPDVDRILTSSMGGIGAARAVYEAARVLAPGDVLIIELHGPGPNARGRGQQGYVPMEWWQPEFDAIRWAVDRGVVVVEAGGNGGEDLDAPVYRRKFDRSVRDSGAILVGAADARRVAMGFSNHGARIDVHGWGGGVATLDYGDLQGCDLPARKYTARFAGTSSASPVVAGAAIVVQSAWKRVHGTTLSPRDLRAVLAATGTPPARDARIGPLPHVGRALEALGLR